MIGVRTAAEAEPRHDAENIAIMLRELRKIFDRKRHSFQSKLCRALIAALCAAASGALGETRDGAAPMPVPLAVVDFDYHDTSGEARDQKAEHAARLKEFMQSLRRDLERSGAYKVVSLDCGSEPCSVMQLTPEELFEAVRKAGARLVLFGGFHKMSTLLQWGQAQVIDVEKNVVIDDRHISFRGDSDDAWRRAETFLVKQLTDEPPTR